MSNFWNGEFYFNSIHSSTYKICLVDIGNSDILKEHGVSKTIDIEKSSSVRGTNYFNESATNGSDIVLHICRTDGMPWTVADLMNVKSWLIQKNYKKFQSVDYAGSGANIVTYVKAIGDKNFLNSNMEGYIEITFSTYDGFYYMIPNNNFILSLNETKNLNCYSNIGVNYKPKLKITNLGTQSEVIRIKNNTLGTDYLEIKNMSNRETVIVDCKMGTVVGNGQNKFNLLSNYNFLELKYGDNSISLTGNATVEIMCEFPIQL